MRRSALSLLAACYEAGIRLGLVTSSSSALAEVVVRAVRVFEVVVTGDDVTRFKPHPEPYLTASRQLGALPLPCVALEDSVPGLTAAVASGCVAIGIAHLADLSDVAGSRRWSTLEGRTVDHLRSELTDAPFSGSTANVEALAAGHL